MSHGSSLSSKNRRTKIMQKLITDTSSDDEDTNDTFVERMLNMIDKKHNDGGFKYTVTNGCCTKSTKLMSSVCWKGVSEAASLRINQQKTIKKFLNLYFGHTIVESDKKLTKFNYVYMPYVE